MSRSPSELEKLLWKSAEADAPPSGGAKRLTAALTSRLETLSSTTLPPAPTPSAPAAVAAASRSTAWKVAGSVSALIVPLAAAFVLVRTTVPGQSTPPGPAETLPSRQSGQVAPIAAPPRAAEPIPSSASVLAVDDLPPAPTTTTATTRRLVPAAPPSARAPRSPEPTAVATVVAAAPPATRSSDLDAEVATLDKVRELLRDGTPARATALLTEYDARFPHGLLRPEAKVLQIEARAAAGDRAVAHDLAVSFLARYPNDPHAERIRELEAQLRP